MQNVPSEVLTFAKSQGFDIVSYVMEWEGYSVFSVSHDTGGKVFYTGYPFYALAKKNELIRLATFDEVLSIMSAY